MKTNKTLTTFNIVLDVVVLLLTIAADVLTIIALTSSPLWKTNIVEAIFWTIIMVLTIGCFNGLVLAMIKDSMSI